MTAAPPHSLKVKIDSFLIALLIAAVPVNLLSDLGRASTVFYVLAVVALSICFSRVGGLRATLETLSPYRGLVAGTFGRALFSASRSAGIWLNALPIR